MILFFKINISVLTLSTNDLLNLSKLSTREVFENRTHFYIIPNVMTEWSQICKLIDTSLGLNTLINVSIILET